MANTGFRGIDVLQTANELVFDTFMLNSSGTVLSTGTTTLTLYELQSDGTLKSYDYSSNTFKTTALTTATVNMTQQTGNNSTTNTGIWTYSLATLTGFTNGAIYYAQVNNSGATPQSQTRKFQFGGAQGDLLMSGNYLEVDVEQWKTVAPNALNFGRVDSATSIRSGTAQAGSSNTITLDAGASATNDYQDVIILLTGGTGSGQARSAQSYVGSTKVATVFPNWTTTPDNTTAFTLLPMGQVDVGNWLNGTIPAVSQTGVPITDPHYWSGTVFPSTATAGIPDVNVKNWNNQTSQTDANNLPIVDVGDWLGHAVTVDANNLPNVNVKDYNGSVVSAQPYTGTPPTAAAIATAIWTDTTSGDFTTTSSPGKILVAQLGGAFTTTSSSVYTTASLANAPTGGSAPTVGQIATAVWQDLTASGDFTTAGSIGKLLATMTFDSNGGIKADVIDWLGVAVTADGSNLPNVNVKDYNGSVVSAQPYTGTPPTAAAIATQVWTDTTSSDFTTTSSPGKILVAQLGGAFTTTASSIYTSASLANAPTGGTAPTVAQIATGVWQDLTSSSDFTTAGSIGKLLAGLLFDGSGYVKANAETVSDKTGYALASAGLDAIVVESGLNARQSLSIIASASAGVLAGAATTTVTIAAAGVSATNRITATVDSSGDRTAVTLSPPA